MLSATTSTNSEARSYIPFIRPVSRPPLQRRLLYHSYRSIRQWTFPLCLVASTFIIFHLSLLGSSLCNHADTSNIDRRRRGSSISCCWQRQVRTAKRNHTYLLFHSNQKTRSRSEIVSFFATISQIRTYPFAEYLDLATMILGIARFRYHSSRVSQIAKTTSYPLFSPV